ncbi:hypothetical protein COO60DRAFT_285548 [Scenedesmus sp. NREL 46B-D3]|nr:hypothetical protein COO60DRAFT_285548 [Scenedesmus sp. NREL 46B-D3]
MCSHAFACRGRLTLLACLPFAAALDDDDDDDDDELQAGQGACQFASIARDVTAIDGQWTAVAAATSDISVAHAMVTWCAVGRHASHCANWRIAMQAGIQPPPCTKASARTKCRCWVQADCSTSLRTLQSQPSRAQVLPEQHMLGAPRTHTRTKASTKMRRRAAVLHQARILDSPATGSTDAILCRPTLGCWPCTSNVCTPRQISKAGANHLQRHGTVGTPQHCM